MTVFTSTDLPSEMPGPPRTLRKPEPPRYKYQQPRRSRNVASATETVRVKFTGKIQTISRARKLLPWL